MNWLIWSNIKTGERTIAHAVVNFQAKQTLCGIRISGLTAPAYRSTERCSRCEAKVRKEETP